MIFKQTKLRHLKPSLAPTIAAGGVAVLVGFTSAIAILFQAAASLGATAEQTSSMIAALCFGAGITSIIFSYRYKKPILMAFSTTGAALLATNADHRPFGDFIGAFIFCALLTILSGATGWFERAMNRIPTSLASAMLAGVLLKFGLEVFSALRKFPFMVGAMLLTYIVLRRLRPRYAVIAVLCIGLVLGYFSDLVHLDLIQAHVSLPVLTTPSFHFATFIGVGLPLFVVTMASQNLPGIAVMRACGYQPPISPVITGSGVATLLLAPFGGFGINFAAITAAIVMGPESHEDASKRYVGALVAGVCYLLIAVFASTVSAFFQSVPSELVGALAGIALIATIANSLSAAVKDEFSREPAILTFLTTASGISLFGIGSAFWGLFVGGAAMAALHRKSDTI